MPRYILLIFTLFPFSLDAQERFNILIDHNKFWQTGLASIELKNGGFISIIKSVGSEYSDNKLFIVRLNSDGKMLSDIEIYESGYIYYVGADCFKPTPDGAFLIGGAFKEIATDVTKACLIKIDSIGNIIWRKTYGTSGSGDTAIDDFFITDDGNIVSCGYSNRSDPSGNMYVVKTTLSGESLWQQDFGGVGWQNAYQIAPTPDGGFVMATMSGTSFFTDYYVIKLDSLGQIAWQKAVGSNFSDGVMPRISALNDGSCLFVGATGTAGDQRDAYIAKLSAEGEILWEKNYPGEFTTSFFTRPVILSDGSFVLTGGYYIKPIGGGGGQLRIAKIGYTGELIWQRLHYHHPDRSHYGYALSPAADGGFIVSGFTHGDSTRQDAWFLKVDSEGCLVENCDITDTNSPVTATPVNLSPMIYPNPVTERLWIDSPQTSILHLSLTTTDGKLLDARSFPAQQAVHNYSWDMARLSSGIYILSVRTDKGYAQKIIVKS